MSSTLRHRPLSVVILGFLTLATTVGRATGASVKETYPIQGLTTRQRAGGLVSIPGSPLPPVSRSSVKDAIALYEPLVGVIRAFGETPAVARGIGYLAALYASIGDASRAEQLFAEAQKILERNEATGRDLGWVNNNRGLARLEQQRYADAAQSFRAALVSLKPRQQDLLEPRAIALQNLAAVSDVLGDFAGAEGAYLDALAILRRLSKERTGTYFVTRANLANLYASIGDFVAARKILADLAAENGLGSSLRFAVLNDLGYVLRGMKDFPAAEIRLREAAALTEEGSRERALCLTNLAATQTDAGQFERARQNGEQALRLTEELYGADSVSASAVLGTLGTIALARGDLPNAESLLIRATVALAKGTGNQQALAGVTQVLALVAQRRGERLRAIDLSRQALILEKKNLDSILAFGSETQRLAYRNNAYPYDQLANLGDATLLGEAVLATKGVVLESLLTERALVRKSRSPADQQRLDHIHELRIKLMEHFGRGDGAAEELEHAVGQEETALALSLAGRAPLPRQRPDLAQVQAVVGADEVLIEIIRFQFYEGGGRLTPHYGGIVIPHIGSPAWVPLGPADVLDESIGNLVSRLDGGNRGIELISGTTDVVQPLHELNERLWKPLERALPKGVRQIVLSPDGATHFVPWACLLDDNDSFLAERWQLAEVASGRDLLRAPATTADKTILALADGMDDLPFSRQEVEGVARIAEKQGWRTTILRGEQASESQLFQRPHPRILHLATHGGQWHDDPTQTIESRLSSQPMYRGFLLLGGASRTLKTWKSGNVVPFSDDGILTAEEAAGLDLHGTWLTVLSACRSGVGDPRIGEGVLGLRRGFALAGTETLLFSLWSVDDAATAQFMEAFYERLFQTWNPTRAFQETQTAELRRWRKTRGITASVYLAGGFVLTK